MKNLLIGVLLIVAVVLLYVLWRSSTERAISAPRTVVVVEDDGPEWWGPWSHGRPGRGWWPGPGWWPNPPAHRLGPKPLRSSGAASRFY